MIEYSSNTGSYRNFGLKLDYTNFVKLKNGTTYNKVNLTNFNTTGKNINIKHIFLGDNTNLHKLGIDEYCIIKKEGNEPIVKFTFRNTKMPVSFIQKKETEKMRSFISLLKDIKNSSVKYTKDAIKSIIS